jgi:hypothetical protein
MIHLVSSYRLQLLDAFTLPDSILKIGAKHTLWLNKNQIYNPYNGEGNIVFSVTRFKHSVKNLYYIYFFIFWISAYEQ